MFALKKGIVIILICVHHEVFRVLRNNSQRLFDFKEFVGYKFLNQKTQFLTY